MDIKMLKKLVDTTRFASVDFVTDSGKNRTINGRTRVAKHITGKGKKRNNDALGLLSIWETPKPQDKERDGKKRYRYIRAENVKAIRADGVEIRVTK
jgi:hypothetical protein